MRIKSRENPDWGYARNLRTVLMTTSAEWVQSCASSPLSADGSEFIAPNRDYPYEGLSFFQDGEKWKFIDAIAISVRSRDNRHLQLESQKPGPDVEVNPWQVTYRYRAANLQPDDPFAKLAVTVSYRLHSATDAQKGASGEVRVSFPDLTERDTVAIAAHNSAFSRHSARIRRKLISTATMSLHCRTRADCSQESQSALDDAGEPRRNGSPATTG